VAKLAQAARPTLFHGPHRRLVTEPGEQTVTSVLAPERLILRACHLVADHGECDAVACAYSLHCR